LLELIRTVLLVIYFGYASYQDLKTKQVSNRIWLIAILTGTPMLIFDLATQDPYMLILYVVVVVMMFLVSCVLFYLAKFGGADAKALITLGLTMPYLMPVYVFANSMMVFLIYGLVLLLWKRKNALKIEVQLLPFIFVGLLISLALNNFLLLSFTK
jgi:Flp pilus assembly protein protease CpaA